MSNACSYRRSSRAGYAVRPFLSIPFSLLIPTLFFSPPQAQRRHPLFRSDPRYRGGMPGLIQILLLEEEVHREAHLPTHLPHHDIPLSIPTTHSHSHSHSHSLARTPTPSPPSSTSTSANKRSRDRQPSNTLPNANAGGPRYDFEVYRPSEDGSGPVRVTSPSPASGRGTIPPALTLPYRGQGQGYDMDEDSPASGTSSSTPTNLRS